MKKLLFVILILLIACFTATAQDMNNYVSLNGKFYIEYPANWQQVPRADVNRYLEFKNAGRPLYDYDAVFAPKNSNPFYSGVYFIMSFEPVGNLSDKQIDSVLQELSATFGQGIKYMPVANYMADIKTDAPNYDKNTKTVSIYNKIVQGDTSIKNSLIMMKFYQHGIVTFYCYTMGDAFETDKTIFNQIVSSLSTEDFKSKLPKENVKVADIDTTKKSYTNTDDDSSNTAIYIVLGVVLLITILRKRRKK